MAGGFGGLPFGASTQSFRMPSGAAHAAITIMSHRMVNCPAPTDLAAG